MGRLAAARGPWDSWAGGRCAGSALRLWLLGVLSLGVLVFGLAPSAHAAEAFGGIAGKVTDAVTRAPLQGIAVCAITTNYELLGEEESEYEHSIGCEKTNAGGEYKISGLRPEGFFVEFFATPASKLNYIPQLYDDKFKVSEASPVSVAAEATTAGIDAELSPGAEIAGRVANAATGAPISDAEVCALRTNAKGSLEAVSCAETEASGEYTIRGVPSGSYKLGFFAQGFELGFYNGKSSEAEAELLSVIAPELTQGIDDALKPGGPSSSPSTSTPSESASASKLPGGLTTSSSTSADATLSLVGRRIAAAHNGDALIKVDCAGTASCRAKLTLKTTMAVRVKGRRTLRTVTIGTSVVISVVAGKTATVQIKLNSAGRKLLRDHRHLKVDLTLVTPGHKQDDSVVLIERKARSRK